MLWFEIILNNSINLFFKLPSAFWYTFGTLSFPTESDYNKTLCYGIESAMHPGSGQDTIPGPPSSNPGPNVGAFCGIAERLVTRNVEYCLL